tara:strand:- start:2 stop:703 length:702 start_codon:yes stop_codon:yes gene_type:complete
MSTQFNIGVVIACYNEIANLETVFNRIHNCGVPIAEIIVVDDGSTDGSREFLTQHKDLYNLTLIFHCKNKGKGACLQTGFAQVTADLIIIQDADLEYHPNDYSKLIAPFVSQNADVVYGSRFTGRNLQNTAYFWHSVANKMITFLSNIFTNLNLTDIETCYKVFRKDILNQLHLQENRFGIEPEITAKIAKLKCRIVEVGISYEGRSYKEGKKITLKDAFRAVWCIMRYSLSR